MKLSNLALTHLRGATKTNVGRRKLFKLANYIRLNKDSLYKENGLNVPSILKSVNKVNFLLKDVSNTCPTCVKPEIMARHKQSIRQALVKYYEALQGVCIKTEPKEKLDIGNLKPNIEII